MAGEIEPFLEDINEHEAAAQAATAQRDEALRQINTDIHAIGNSQATLRILELFPDVPVDPDNSPEQIAQTVSTLEMRLYEAVTDAVRAQREASVHSFQATYTRENLLKDIEL